MNTRAFLLSAGIAGLAAGILGNLPLLNLVNCILCVWVWLGGVLAVYLYRRYRPADPGLTAAQGAGLGAVTGLIAAVVGFVVFLVSGSLSLPLMERMARAFQLEGDLPLQTGGWGGMIVQALIFLALDLVLYPLFGALAGMIAANVFWKRPAAAL